MNKINIKKWLLYGAAGLGLALAVFYGWYRFNLLPSGGQPAGFAVEPGQTPTTIATNLRDQELIRSDWAFVLYVRLHGIRSQLKAGWYEIDPAKSAAEVAGKIAAGETDMDPLTIPEGFTVKQIAGRLQKLLKTKESTQGWLKPEQYSGELLDKRPQNAGLEGYLFPSTYFVSPLDRPQVVMQRMVSELDRQFTDEMRDKAADSKLSIHEVLTLASLIEREVADDSDRAKVAQVLLLRIERGMALQVDASVLYAAGRHTENSSDIAALIRDIDSPYNTYKYSGLPPGPIANPGLDSINAALNPADTDFLYYLSDNGGNTHFARTLQEHERNVDKYLR